MKKENPMYPGIEQPTFLDYFVSKDEFEYAMQNNPLDERLTRYFDKVDEYSDKCKKEYPDLWKQDHEAAKKIADYLIWESKNTKDCDKEKALADFLESQPASDDYGDAIFTARQECSPNNGDVNR